MTERGAGLSPAAPLGVFGGTFDPLHYAHLRLAEEAIDALGLGGVRWIPAGRPAHRATPAADAAQRLAMVRLATADNPRFELDAAETLAEQPSYTVPTLERLRRDDACGERRPLVLLVGADAFAGISAWHRWQDLFELAHVAIAHRPGYRVNAASAAWPPALATVFAERYRAEVERLQTSPAGHIVCFAMTPLDISATKIRALLSNRLSVRYLLPDALCNYIEEHHLYLEN